MAEFKKLSEVEQLETAPDNATVLIEEGGEIKRVPKKEVGGVGGYVIRLANSYLDDDSNYCMEENYDELYDILSAGGSVWVDYTDAPEESGPLSLLSITSATNISPARAIVMGYFLTDIGLVLSDSTASSRGARIYYPNGSHNLESNEIES